MSKRRDQGFGFSLTPKSKATKAQPSVDHSTKEKQAIALINQGKLSKAETIYRALVSAGTRNHLVYGNLAALCGMQGRFKEVIELLRKALELKPNYPEAHNNLGNALKEQGNLDAAIASYKSALQLKPNYPSAHNNLGNALKQQGNLDAAIASYNSALQFNPNYPDAHYNLGNALNQQGDLDAAIASYNSALQLQPNKPEVHNNLGNALKEQGNLDAAIASYNSALQLNPNNPEAHYNLGNALEEQGNLDAAIASYNSALQRNPNKAEAHNNLGNALKKQGNLDAAIASYNSALQLQPNNTEVINNLGNAHKDRGDLEAAIASYNSALQLEPNDAEAHWNSSVAMLLGGDYKNGWEEYEWRTKRKKTTSKPHAIPKCDQWTSNLALNHLDKLLLITEQGLGDTLQFMRYANVLKNKGISISLCAQPKLHSLIQASGIDPSPLTPQQANQVTEGLYVPLLSLPWHLQVSPSNPIVTEPYIKTTDELTAKWASILATKENPVVGINWQGNPKTEKTDLRGRSLALEEFAPITRCGRISLLSLQKGFGSEQLENCSFKDQFVTCQDQISETWDFLETAAIIANCDLVITSDTSVAHLAGGMGKPTWLLLHKVPEWRWGIEGDTTFWYPSMRLFRQRERGNWNEVMERVADELDDHFEVGLEASPTPQSSFKPKAAQTILAPISLGELIDKITILQIKTQNLQGTGLENVKKELQALESTLNNLQLNIDIMLIQQLKEINQDLWQIENDIRDQERLQNFGETFINLARAIYQKNERRSSIKKEINITYGSSLVEEKSYHQY